MFSVTQRIAQIKQPRGGYIPIKSFSKILLDDGCELFPEENIHASLVGMAVDYLTRFMLGTPATEAFKISLLGADLIKQSNTANMFISNIRGLDDRSIFCACKLVGYDVCFRAGAHGYKPVSTIQPDAATISNVRKMVERSLFFFSKYGPITKDGFTFEGGYTDIISSGDGDFLTQDTLWDFKVSKRHPTSKHTLQLLIYYIMGKHSIHSEFLNINKLGFFNPRLNTVYLLEVSIISSDTIDEVSETVIGYNTGKRKENTTASEAEEWTLNELMQRYGVGRAKITGDFFAYGLPHYKAGRAYRFPKREVLCWEIMQRSIPYNRNQAIVLPGYRAYGEHLRIELEKAREVGDKEAIKRITQEMREKGYTNDPTHTVLIVLAIIALFLILFFILGNR